MNNDPRYVRVRGQLREAEVSRTTFYQHGDCPAQFIADMVVNVLQPYLDDLIDAVASPNENYLLRWWDTYVRMLAELRVHRGFLSALFTPTQPVVVGHITRRLTPPSIPTWPSSSRTSRRKPSRTCGRPWPPPSRSTTSSRCLWPGWVRT